MIEREQAVEEIWKRISQVPGVAFTGRNTTMPPKHTDFPAIMLYELNDEVIEASRRGSTGGMHYRRRLRVVIESFVRATTDAAATKEILAFLRLVKTQLYTGGVQLTRGTAFEEVEVSSVMRPPLGENAVALGIVLDIVYTEVINL